MTATVARVRILIVLPLLDRGIDCVAGISINTHVATFRRAESRTRMGLCISMPNIGTFVPLAALTRGGARAMLPREPPQDKTESRHKRNILVTRECGSRSSGEYASTIHYVSAWNRDMDATLSRHINGAMEDGGIGLIHGAGRTCPCGRGNVFMCPRKVVRRPGKAARPPRPVDEEGERAVQRRSAPEGGIQDDLGAFE